MSVVDYEQTAEDHSSVLLLIQQVGCHLTAKHFNKLYDRLTRVRVLRVKNQHRSISLRYKKFYPSENNDWGEFQAHRKALGVICFAKCNHPSELDELYKLYESIKSTYGNTLFDSRLIVFGLDPNECGSQAGTPEVARKESKSTEKNKSKTRTKLQLDPSQLESSLFGTNRTNAKEIRLTEPDVTSRKIVESTNQNIPDVVPKQDRQDADFSANDHVQYKENDASVENQPPNNESKSELSQQKVNKPSIPKKPDHLKSDVAAKPVISQKPTPAQVEKSSYETIADSGSLKVVNHKSNHGDEPEVRGDRSASMNSQSSDSSASSFTRDAPPYVIFFMNPDDCPNLEAKMHDFVSSLFWVLESKRLDRSQERMDRLPMLCAPFERKDIQGLDADSRNYKKRCQGRLKKHLGDLCMLAGLPGEAMLHYQVAMDTLKSCSDWLWLGAALEGLCACHVAVASPSIDAAAARNSASLPRNHSFNVTSASDAAREATKSKSGSRKGPLNGLEGRERLTRLPEDIGEKYRDAIMYYAKYRQMAVVETECNIKACRVLASQQKYLEASGFLQNLVYINIPLTEDEKILRYNTLSSLYALLHMQRKSGFFKRIAAMQCVAPSNPKPGWIQCYYLLLQALPGYDISLDPKHKAHDTVSGWPAAQLRVLHELIYSARKMGNPAIAIRHITYLIHVMFEHLSATDREELVKILHTYTPHCEGSAQTLALENGVILPPVPFHRFPTVTVFKPECPAEKLRAFKIKKAASLHAQHGSPFIYSPLMQAAKSHIQPSRMDFVWQAGDECYVTVEAHNPLPMPLHVTHMALMTDGVSCQSSPLDVTIDSESQLQFLIKTTPTQPGLLKLFGYQTLVLGCRSNCRFRDMAPYFDLNQFEVKVIPRLPELSLSMRCDSSRVIDDVTLDEDGVTHAALTLYAGQSCECCLFLQNNTDIPIEHFQVTSQSNTPGQSLLAAKVVRWEVANLRSQLPVRANSQAVLTLYLTGAAPVTQDHAQTVEMSITIEYSGGAGLEEDYCRHCEIQLSITLAPAIVVKEMQATPSFNSELCHLMLRVENASQYPMSITSPELGNGCQVSSQQTCRLKIPVLKCKEQTVSTNQNTDNFNKGFHQSETEILPGVQSNQSTTSIQICKDLAAQISEHLRNTLDVRWTLIGPDVSGRAELCDWSWSPEDLQQFTVSPLAARICVHGRDYTDTDDVMVTSLNTPVPIVCSFTNTLDCDIYFVSCCLSASNQRPAIDIHQSALLFLGQSSANIDQLNAGKTLRIETEVQFLTCGTHSLIVTCEGRSKITSGSAHGQGQRQSLITLPEIIFCVQNDEKHEF